MEEEDFKRNEIIADLKRTFWIRFGFAIGMIFVWVILLMFIHSTGGIIAINIGFYVLISIALGQASCLYLLTKMSTWLAVLSSIGIVVLVVIPIRSLISTALETII